MKTEGNGWMERLPTRRGTIRTLYEWKSAEVGSKLRLSCRLRPAFRGSDHVFEGCR